MVKEIHDCFKNVNEVADAVDDNINDANRYDGKDDDGDDDDDHDHHDGVYYLGE